MFPVCKIMELLSVPTMVLSADCEQSATSDVFFADHPALRYSIHWAFQSLEIHVSEPVIGARHLTHQVSYMYHPHLAASDMQYSMPPQFCIHHIQTTNKESTQWSPDKLASPTAAWIEHCGHLFCLAL